MWRNVLNSCWIRSTPLRRTVETRLYGGEGGIDSPLRSSPLRGASIAGVLRPGPALPCLVEPKGSSSNIRSPDKPKGPARGPFGLLAVEAVYCEPVSASFPDNGKFTGEFASLTSISSGILRISCCNICIYLAQTNGSAIHNREFIDTSRTPVCGPGRRADWS